MKSFSRLLAGLMVAMMLTALLLVGGPIASAADPTVGATATLNGGTLSIEPANSFSYTTTLNATDTFLTSSFAVTVTDPTGSYAGWKLQAAIGQLSVTEASPTNPEVNITYTIPLASHTITSVDNTLLTGTAPNNNIGYPLQIPASGSIYNAAIESGMGQSSHVFQTKLVIPADVKAGAYTATMTLSIVTGP